MANSAFAMPIPSSGDSSIGILLRRQTQNIGMTNSLTGLRNGLKKDVLLGFGQPSKGTYSTSDGSDDSEKRQLGTLLSTLKTITEGIEVDAGDQRTGTGTEEAGSIGK